ncbi:MAG TPA: zinc ribbon domain-containing protein [Tissierellia bacterium]|nr:zinc ribbon domain-containing protein [Tissierellia bacterium]
MKTKHPASSNYQKPTTVCKNCATPLNQTDRYCPSCGFDQQRSIARQTSTGKATRFIGPMVGLFAFLLLIALALGATYYFISQANSDKAVRDESLVIVGRSTNETIARLKETDTELSEDQWTRLRELLSRDDYRERMSEALRELRSGDLEIAPGEKTLRYIPTHRLSLRPVTVEVLTAETPYRVELGEESLDLSANDRGEVSLMPGIYQAVYHTADGPSLTEEVEVSHHAKRFQNDRISLYPRAGAVLPTIRSIYQSGRIFIDGQDSNLSVRDVDHRPELLGIHPPGTKYQLKIDTPMGQVVTNEVEQAEGPISFELVNGLVLARAQPEDIVFVNGENVGSYRDFADCDYVVGPIELGTDVVRLQGEGTEQTPFEQSLTESLGGKEVALELTEELKGTLMNATRRFVSDSYESLKQKSMEPYSNIQPGSPIEERLNQALEEFKQGDGSLDYEPFAIRFSNDSFRVYAQDGRAYAEFIESYYIKYIETDYQNHTSWHKKMIYDQAQDKWLFYDEELLYDYVIPEDNTLVYIQ